MELDAFPLNLKNLLGGVGPMIKKPSSGKLKILMLKVCWFLNLQLLNLVYHGRRPEEPQQPLQEAAVDRPPRSGHKNTVSVLESENKEPRIEPFICLEKHWLIPEVFDGAAPTPRQCWRGTGISDCFLKARRANPTETVMGPFFSSLKYLFLSQSTTLQIISH